MPSLRTRKVATEIKGEGVEYPLRTVHNLMRSKADEIRSRIRALNREDPIKRTTTAPGVAQKTTEVKGAKIKIIITTTTTTEPRL